MFERDPFSKEGRTKILDNPERDVFSVEGDRDRENRDVFGAEEFSSSKAFDEAGVRKKRTRAWIIGGLAVSGVILAVSVAFGWSWYRANLFKSDRVVLTLDGPETVSANNTEHFVLTYENQNKTDLENVVLSLRFPDNFMLEEKNGMVRDGITSARVQLGTIAAQQKGTFDFYGYFSGTLQSTAYIRTTMQYSPKSVSGSFQQEAQKGVKMDDLIIGVDMTAPIEFASGGMADIAVQYRNRSAETLYSLRLKMQYPEGFEFVGSDAVPSEGNTVWYIDPLAPGEVRTLKVHGKLSGDRGTFREFSASFGVVRGDASFLVYGKDVEKIKIVGSPFSIRTVLNFGGTTTVFSGSDVKGAVRYSNDGERGLGNAVVRVTLEGKIADESSILVENGSYDASTKTMTWRASDVEGLAFVGPKQAGTVNFSFAIKKTIPVETENDTRFVESMTASIDSADVPDKIGAQRVVAQDVATVRLGTSATITTDVRENGTGTNLPDVMFSVGKETELVVYTRLRNLYNDISDATYTIGIPSGVSFAGTITLEKEENVVYNERSQQLVWEVGKLRAGTGSFLPDRVIAFRLKVTPQANQLGHFTLLNAEALQGKDTFTGDAVSVSQNPIVVSRVTAPKEE